MGNIEELNRTNIELCENFEGCTKSPDGKCMIAQKYKEWIADQEWKAVDETSSQGEGKEKLNQETSYMVCTEYEGAIYFYDDGQVIRDFLDIENDSGFSEWARTKRTEKILYFKTYIEVAKLEQLKWGIPWQLTLTQIAYFDSYEEGIVYHSELLMEDKYSEAWEYMDNPFIYLAIIAPIYAPPGNAYVEQAGKIMDDYFEWEGKEKDWEDYEAWKENH